MISSAHLTASEIAATVAGTRLPPSYLASFQAARIAAMMASTRFPPFLHGRRLSVSLVVRYRCELLIGAFKTFCYALHVPSPLNSYGKLLKLERLRVEICMADAKIDIKIGAISFAAEGSEKWLSGELDKVLAKAPELAAITPAEPENGDGGGTKHAKKGKLGTLAHFLKEKSATSNQVKKFLATAAYLHDTTGKDRLTTGEVKTALKNANQTKLNNPSDCLNQNVGKGHAEKDGGSFFVTDPGRTSLGA